MENGNDTRFKRSTRNAAPNYRESSIDNLGDKGANSGKRASNPPSRPKKRALTSIRKTIICKFLQDEYRTPSTSGLVGSPMWMKELVKKLTDDNKDAGITNSDVRKWLQISPFSNMVKILKQNEKDAQRVRSKRSEQPASEKFKQSSNLQDDSASSGSVQLNAENGQGGRTAASSGPEVPEDSSAPPPKAVKLGEGNTFQDLIESNGTGVSTGRQLEPTIHENMEVDSDSATASGSSIKRTVEVNQKPNEGDQESVEVKQEPAEIKREPADDCALWQIDAAMNGPGPLISVPNDGNTLAFMETLVSTNESVGKTLLEWNAYLQTNGYTDNTVLISLDHHCKGVMDALNQISSSIRQKIG